MRQSSHLRLEPDDNKCKEMNYRLFRQANRSTPQIGGNIMLGNPLYDRGVFFQQFFIPLLGGVLYAGKEEPLINMEAFDDFFLVYLP